MTAQPECIESPSFNISTRKTFAHDSLAGIYFLDQIITGLLHKKREI